MSVRGGEWGVMDVERRGNKRDVGMERERKRSAQASYVVRLTYLPMQSAANHVACLKINHHVYNIGTCHFPRVEKRAR